MAILHFENTSQEGKYIMLRGRTTVKDVNGIEEEIMKRLDISSKPYKRNDFEFPIIDIDDYNKIGEYLWDLRKL